MNLKSRKLVYGVGDNDSDYVTQPGNGLRCPYFDRWHSMLRRCYSKNSLAKFPAYKDVLVVKEWHTFSVFKVWMESQEWVGNVLDKDLRGDGKTYGPSSCTFISQQLNRFIATSGTDGLMLGARLKFTDGRKNCYIAQAMVRGKKTHLGVFDSEFKAHNAWQRSAVSELQAFFKIEGYAAKEAIQFTLDGIVADIQNKRETNRLHSNDITVVKEITDFVIAQHGEQKYGDSPYSTHLFEVVDKTLKMFSNRGFTNRELSVVAIGHDQVEDAGVTYEAMIFARFSVQEAKAIMAISKRDDLSYADYIAQVRANPLALKVKIADTLCNLTHSLVDGNIKRITKYTTQLQLLKGIYV